MADLPSARVTYDLVTCPDKMLSLTMPATTLSVVSPSLKIRTHSGRTISVIGVPGAGAS